MYRSTLSYSRPVAFVLLALVLLASMMLWDQRAAAAQTPALAQEEALCEGENPATPPLERPFEDGGTLCVSDWVGYLPLGIASVITVIVVDGVFLYYIYRKMQRGEELA